MDDQQARLILKDTIQPNNSLYNLGHYTNWNVGDKEICLDSDFTLEYLEALVYWIKTYGVLRCNQ